MQAEAIRADLRRQPRRFSTTVLLGTSLVVALALLFGLRDQETIPAAPDVSTSRLSQLGIEVDYPSNWYLQPFDEDLGLARHSGAVISNVEHRFVHPDPSGTDSTSAWDMSGLPEGVIVLSFQQLDRHNFEAKRTTGFPLDLEDARVSRDDDTYGAPQPRYFIPFAVDGHLGSGVQVYIGDVGPAERAAVERILASVRPIAP